MDEVLNSPYEYPQAYMLKSDALFETGHVNEALVDINKSLELNPDVSYSWYLKARILMGKSNYDDALECFKKAVSIDKNIDCYWFDMASCYLSMSMHDDAYDTYTKAFELNPHSGGIANQEIFLDFIKDLKLIA